MRSGVAVMRGKARNLHRVFTTSCHALFTNACDVTAQLREMICL